MIDYSQLKKGSFISESMYGITIFSTIISEVKEVKGLYHFKAITDSGSNVDYILGGTYSPNVEIVTL
jgi:hypothetical protein